MGVFTPASDWSRGSEAKTPAEIKEAEGQISKNLLMEALPEALVATGEVEPNHNGQFLVLSAHGETLQVADIPNSQNIQKIVITNTEINWIDIKQTSYGAVQTGYVQGELYFKDDMPGPCRIDTIPVTLFVEPESQTTEYTSATMEKLNVGNRNSKDNVFATAA